MNEYCLATMSYHHDGSSASLKLSFMIDIITKQSLINIKYKC